MLKCNHYYTNGQYGMFYLSHISKNGILITIYNLKGEKKVVIHKYLSNSVEIQREMYKEACNPEVVKLLMHNK